MNIPISCGKCKYGNTRDMSIDDLNTFCFILGYDEDSCDFPNRRDGTRRMRGCPLPKLMDEQVKMAEQRLEAHKLKKVLFRKMLKGKTKLIRKRNASRLIKLSEKIDTGGVSLNWIR